MQGYEIYDSNLDSIDFRKNKIINTINTHSYCIAEKDIQFREALLSSDLLLPDGIGIVWAENFLNAGGLKKKIAGNDLFLFLMKKINNECGSVFFLGGSEETLEKIKIRTSHEYPNISLGSYSPPYKDTFSDDDSKIMCNEVNMFNPDVLFVGMTAPKQEKWIHAFQKQLKAKTICSIGAVFDFYAGNVNRAPKFMIRLGLEWFHRSMTSKRLFKRNFISNPKFIFHVIKLKFVKSFK
jgi:N-acetylglucosaminyldiphosphoundecaprenol N-acetyl-beta-D-mannosaminyltransferase